MFRFKKPEPAVYHSEATGAEFKFRQSNAGEREKLELFVGIEQVRNNPNSRMGSLMEKDNYYAAWLLEDFSGVEDENGKSHEFAKFDLDNKAKLIQTLKQTDSEFAPWFASHCEGVEKKIEEAPAAESLVGTASLPAVHSKQRKGV
ncbi:hypothetical protein R83H12_00432 [Fibrobacteria bacterium R8-3-H12]